MNSRSNTLQQFPYYHTSAPAEDEWGQPPASTYIFLIQDNILLGSPIRGSYIPTYSYEPLLTPKPCSPVTFGELDTELLSWLKLSESAFDFWNNEQDAIYDEL